MAGLPASAKPSLIHTEMTQSEYLAVQTSGHEFSSLAFNVKKKASTLIHMCNPSTNEAKTVKLPGVCWSDSSKFRQTLSQEIRKSRGRQPTWPLSSMHTYMHRHVHIYTSAAPHFWSNLWGHLPPALFKSQIHACFSRFGTIVRFRLSRFGSSCSYAFAEFENEDVAEMVVEIMNAAILVKDFSCVVSRRQKKDV